MTLSMLAVASLALLSERPMHPYEMYQLLIARSEDRLIKVRPGSLYHAVDRLHDDGLVADVGTDRSGNRPERTTYEITPHGRTALADWLRETIREPVNEFPRFPLALSEAHNLPLPEATALIRERIATLDADRAFVDSKLQLLTIDPHLEERWFLDAEYQIAVLTAEIDWLGALVERIESGDLPW